VKTSVYATEVNTLEDLEIRMINVVQTISQAILQNMLNETIRRWKECVEVNGKHVEHLLK
jgi:hypothetical protein